MDPAAGDRLSEAKYTELRSGLHRLDQSLHTRYWFAFVMACIECLFIPFGTILGVFTIIVLSRESVKTLFWTVAEAPPLKNEARDQQSCWYSHIFRAPSGYCGPLPPRLFRSSGRAGYFQCGRGPKRNFLLLLPPTGLSRDRYAPSLHAFLY